MATLLAKKSGTQDNAVATDDEHHEALASDPAVEVFPQGSSFGGSNGFNSTSSFGSAASSFGAPATTATSNFGSSVSAGGPNNSQSGNQAAALQSTGGAMQQGADVLVENDNTDWINKKWRPVMGWVYMMTCTADFVIFPVLWSLLQALTHGNVSSQWQPLTLQGAGLYHIAMGAVLGIAAYGRTKEKIEGAAK